MLCYWLLLWKIRNFDFGYRLYCVFLDWLWLNITSFWIVLFFFICFSFLHCFIVWVLLVPLFLYTQYINSVDKTRKLYGPFEPKEEMRKDYIFNGSLFWMIMAVFHIKLFLTLWKYLEHILGTQYVLCRYFSKLISSWSIASLHPSSLKVSFS